jgi:hypothetical protein
MKKQNVEMMLIGGLGNQLFELFAGLNFALTLEASLSINVSMLNRIGQSHSNSIKSINFNELSQKFDYVDEKESKFMYRLQSKISRSLPSQQIEISRITRRYYSPTPGFDPNLPLLTPPVKLYGYFQSWRNVYGVKERVGHEIKLTVEKPSKWFLEMEKAALAALPIMLHLRRGDYTRLSKSFGLLSSNYYLNAIKELESDFGNREIWIFSDNTSEAERLSSKILNHSARVIYVPAESSDFESLKLLSLGCSIITANSTFSWWAAMLSSEESQKIVPDKWFRSLPEPTDLIPKDWRRLKSSWEI